VAYLTSLFGQVALTFEDDALALLKLCEAFAKVLPSREATHGQSSEREFSTGSNGSIIGSEPICAAHLRGSESVNAIRGKPSQTTRGYRLRWDQHKKKRREMFAWIRRRFLAPHPLRLTETLARLEGLSWDDSEQHPSAIEPGGDSCSQAYACPGSSTRQPLGTLFQPRK
jgi:hypothetical protein